MHVVMCISKSLPIREPARVRCLFRYDCLCSGSRKGIINFCLHARVSSPPKIVRIFAEYLGNNSNPRYSRPAAPVRTVTDDGLPSRSHTRPIQRFAHLNIHS
jgi:hypothetical protein